MRSKSSYRVTARSFQRWAKTATAIAVMCMLAFFFRSHVKMSNILFEEKEYSDMIGEGHLTDAVAHTRYRENILPLALAMFDWTIYDHDTEILKRSQTPSYVFCQASQKSINRLADELPEGFRGSVLLVGGEDLHLSDALEQTNLQQLASRFHITRYEAKDIPDESIGTFPMGLLPHYTMKHNEFKIRQAIQSASLDNKPQLLLAAWGKIWPHLGALQSRKEADDFLRSVAWAEKKSIDLDMWWSTLKLHKFMLCPTGNGIQSPKFVEALLTLTIPVVQNESAYYDLKLQGFPLLIVNSWSELSPEMLENHWRLLSPKLHWARSIFITKKWYDFVTSENPGRDGIRQRA